MPNAEHLWKRAVVFSPGDSLSCSTAVLGPVQLQMSELKKKKKRQAAALFLTVFMLPWEP